MFLKIWVFRGHKCFTNTSCLSVLIILIIYRKPASKPKPTLDSDDDDFPASEDKPAAPVHDDDEWLRITGQISSDKTSQNASSPSPVKPGELSLSQTTNLRLFQTERSYR